ncbi:isoleucyl-trna synthetase family protein, partial [Cystoisospora suis]
RCIPDDNEKGEELHEDHPISFLAWTTTPWTLPSNLALCVNPDLVYVQIRNKQTKVDWILCESRVDWLLKQLKMDLTKDFEVVNKFPGSSLRGSLLSSSSLVSKQIL